MAALDAAAAWAGIIGTGCTVGLGGVAFVLRSLIRREVAAVRDDTRQLRTNGGSHLADAINRIESKVDALAEGHAELRGAFAEHVRPKSTV